MILDDGSEGVVKYQNGAGIDNKLKMIANGNAKYFLQDHLGSTVSLTDSSGAVVSSASYDSFGNSTNNLTTRYQYTGREKDEFTGLNYYRNRWYSAELGRFISEDPIGFDGGDINLFGYVKNNPLKFKDPLGLQANPFYAGCVAGYATLGAGVGFYGGGGLGLLTGPGAVVASPLGIAAGTALGGAIGAGIGSLACGTPPFPNQSDVWSNARPVPFPNQSENCDVKPRGMPRMSNPPRPNPTPGDRDGCAEEISACVQLCSEAQYDSNMKHIWGGSRTACLKGCISERCQRGFKF